MGVHGLWKLLDSSGKPIPLETLENKVLAVDVSIWLYQLVKGFQEKAGHSVGNAYLLGLFHRICKLLYYRIKPIFVFDGGVPALKKKTIAARQSNRSKAETIGEKLRISLLENLAKQEALGKALGESFMFPKIFQPKQDTLFHLPPLANSEGNEESDSDSDHEIVRYKDLQSIDINSEDFLSLPPDMRHDILTELKEKRKENSWAKVHLMPEEGSDFSNFQMNRLLKRRAIQVGIEKAEGEMGTRGFTISDLQSILSDQGVELAQRIAADNTTKILYSDNIKCLKDSNSKDDLMKRKKKLGDQDQENKVPDSKVENETRNDNLTQNEILEIIKMENSVPSDLVVKDALNGVSLVSSDLKNDFMKINEDKKLEIGEVVENEPGNSEVELEHGSFPQSNYHCQISPQPSVSFYPDFILDPGSNQQTQNADEIKSENNLSECSSLLKKAENHILNVSSHENIIKIMKKSSDSLSNVFPSLKTKDVNLEEYDDIASGQLDKLPEIKTFSMNKEKMPEIYSSSEESDDFIEVDNEDELEGNFVNTNKIPDPECSSTLTTTQIVINTAEQLKDDIFSDIFEDKFESVNVEVNDNGSINKDIEKCILSFESTSAINKMESSTYDSDEKLSTSEKNYSNTILEKLEQNVKEPIVSQLSIDEIIRMKKDLEQESDYLRNETSREDRIASTITEQITLDAQELLKLFGVPYIVAPMEAEAQCAFLDLTEQTQGTITDDSDIWLFGGKNVYKNFFDQKKFVQQFKSTDIAKSLHMGRDEMIMLALLSGSDYTTGLTGVGSVTALEIIAHFPKTVKESTIMDRLQHFANDYKQSKLKANIISKLRKISISEGFPSYEVIKAYIDPLVDQSLESFSWSKPNLRELRRYTKEKFGWDEIRTDKLLQPVFENLKRTQGQGTLHRYFEWDLSGIENQMSKRVEKAVTLLKEPSLLDKERNLVKIKKNSNQGCSTGSNEKDSHQMMKSKTPAQIARERAARKIRELKKQDKFGKNSKCKTEK